MGYWAQDFGFTWLGACRKVRKGTDLLVARWGAGNEPESFVTKYGLDCLDSGLVLYVSS